MTGKSAGLRFGELGDSAVHICVDMQRMFVEGTPWASDWMLKVLPEVIRLCEKSRARTVFTRFVTPDEPRDTSGSWRRYYTRWPQMTRSQLDESYLELLAPLKLFPEGMVFDKNTYSPWATGTLHQALRSRHVDTVVISGGETDVCVLATVLGAVDAGYRVVVATGALCSSADQLHDALSTWYRTRLSEQIEAASVDEIVANWRD